MSQLKRIITNYLFQRLIILMQLSFFIEMRKVKRVIFSTIQIGYSTAIKPRGLISHCELIVRIS